MKKLILILTLLIVLTSSSQIEFTALQDAKLLFINDDYGNSAPTTDIIIKFGYKSEHTGVSLGYESANLYGGIYTRYTFSLNNEFSLTKKLKLEVEADIFGLIYRFGKYSLSNGVNSTLYYKLTKNLYFGINSQLVIRSDIDRLRTSNFLMFKYKTNKKWH